MSYINKNYVYKIVPKLNPRKAIKLDKKKASLVLCDRIDSRNTANDDDYQNWIFTFDEKFNSYKIINLKTKQMIGYSDTDNSQHILMENTDSEQSIYYHWMFELTNDGCFVIKNAGDTGKGKIDKVLDLRGSDTTNGTPIILFDRTDNRNQKFKLVRHKFTEDYTYEDAKELQTPHIQKENTYKTIEDLKYKVFSSEQFIKKWANIANMLGYRWCNGTRGVDVGDDFKVTRLGNGNYRIEAYYRQGDPFAYAPKPNERFMMEISNVRLTFDPHSIKVDKPTITKLNPTVISTTNAVNLSTSEGTVTTEIEYTASHTVSNSTSNTVANSVSIENSFKLKIQGMKFEESFTYTFGHEKTWAQQEDKTTETKLKSIYSTSVSSGAKLPIYALLYQSKANIPYTAVANIEYNIRFSGHLKNDHALKGKHNKDEKVFYSFGKNNISATKFLKDEYSTRDAYGQNSKWDYTWCILNYDPEHFNKYMSEAMTPDKVEISGIFTNLSSTHVAIVAGKRSDKDSYEVLSENDIEGNYIKEENNPNIKEEITIQVENIK